MLQVAKPQGADWRQRAVFSGDKWIHCHGTQGIFGPDGLFYDWFDVPVGRHSDKYFMRESNVNETLRVAQLDFIRQYWVYLDKGYTNDTHCKCAHHGPAVLTALQVHFNWVMSRARIGVEWGFGKVKARNPLILKPYMLKLQLMDVSKLVRVAVLLTNAHTCLNQSQTGLYFNCCAPTLGEYFN